MFATSSRSEIHIGSSNFERATRLDGSSPLVESVLSPASTAARLNIVAVRGLFIAYALQYPTTGYVTRPGSLPLAQVRINWKDQIAVGSRLWQPDRPLRPGEQSPWLLECVDPAGNALPEHHQVNVAIAPEHIGELMLTPDGGLPEDIQFFDPSPYARTLAYHG